MKKSSIVNKPDDRRVHRDFNVQPKGGKQRMASKREVDAFIEAVRYLYGDPITRSNVPDIILRILQSYAHINKSAKIKPSKSVKPSKPKHFLGYYYGKPIK